jgi:threonylcarbamoyladenosine tRNA methylthiotransferase MtaB
MRVSFHTFGCKLNQFETEALASAFRSRGFSLVDPSAESDLYLVNTCTVTGKSEQKARTYIRRLSRGRPGALVVVTGCYAQLDPKGLAELGPNVTVVSQADKSLLLDLPQRLLEEGEQGGRPAALATLATALTARLYAAAGGEVARPDPFRFRVERYSFHSRAFLKIQDGCDHRCAYCRVPLARGGSVSLAAAAAVERARALEGSGYREVVLTGVNISSYCSSYREGELGLSGLLERLLAATDGIRLRLSSLEPETIMPALVEVLRHPRVCPHFHLPVQSGSDAILLGMRRRYRTEQVQWAVEALRAAREGAFLAADLIAGFPGETVQDFQRTYRLAEDLGFAKLHVFPFSPRSGTPAASMPARVPERVRDERVRALTELSDRLGLRYRQGWVGREVEVVLEEQHRAAPGWQGMSANYLPCRVRGVPPGPAGRLVLARVESGGDPCEAEFLALR